MGLNSKIWIKFWLAVYVLLSSLGSIFIYKWLGSDFVAIASFALAIIAPILFDPTETIIERTKPYLIQIPLIKRDTEKIIKRLDSDKDLKDLKKMLFDLFKGTKTELSFKKNEVELLLFDGGFKDDLEKNKLTSELNQFTRFVRITNNKEKEFIENLKKSLTESATKTSLKDIILIKITDPEQIEFLNFKNKSAILKNYLESLKVKNEKQFIDAVNNKKIDISTFLNGLSFYQLLKKNDEDKFLDLEYIYLYGLLKYMKKDIKKISEINSEEIAKFIRIANRSIKRTVIDEATPLLIERFVQISKFLDVLDNPAN